MSERRVQEPESMDRLMELQSRLRELTEAKKAKWRQLGKPLPDDASPGSSESTHPQPVRTGAETNGGDAGGARSVDAVMPAPATGHDPGEGSASTSRHGSDEALPPEVSAVAFSPSESLGELAHDASSPTVNRFVRRRDASSEWAREARKRISEIRQFAGAFWRQAVGQARDLTGGLGARHAKPKRRPGDPVTAEELIDDRSLGARLLGAAVFFVGLVAIGAVALVQLGKLEIPWLEDNALPAATATAGSGSDAAGEAPLREGPSVPLETDGAPEVGADMEGSEIGAAAGTEPVSMEGAPPDPGSGPPSEAVGTDSDLSEAVAREVREFTRLQGELAFLIGEYEIVRDAFESGDASCEELNAHYSSIDSTHLLMSRVVARWREVPYRQVKAYEEISGLVDGTLRHYAASGCGLDPSELPRGE